MSDILDRLLYEEIREKQNLVYSISSSMYEINYLPTQNYSLSIIFQSDPKNNKLINNEIDKILEFLTSRKILQLSNEEIFFSSVKK